MSTGETYPESTLRAALLSRNLDVDLKALRDMCRRFRLDRRLEAWLRELQASGDE